MDWVWKALLGILLVVVVVLDTRVNAATIRKRSTGHGKKYWRHGDQIFAIKKGDGDDNDDDDDNNEAKRSLDPPPKGEKIVFRGDEMFLKKKDDDNDDDDDDGDDDSISKRSAIRDESFRWSDKTVPYEFDHTFPSKDRDIIKSSMNEWEKHTCLKFRPARDSDKHKVKFVNGDGCFSFVGMVEEPTQDISLDKDGCRYLSTALHEIGHALGMYHTQVRPDRDKYIKIDLSDVKKNLHDNFIKQSWKNSYHYGVDYDFLSIMHYDGTSFTSNGGKSIKTLNPKWQKIIGTAKHLSFGDIEMMNKMYHCAPSNCDKKDSDCPGTSFVDKTCTCVCPGPSPTHPVINCADRGGGFKQTPATTAATTPAAPVTSTGGWDDEGWEETTGFYY